MGFIGERVRQVRDFRKITQKEMSDRVCVTQSYISRVEIGKEMPTDMLIKLIALEFSISYAWLRDGTGDMDIYEKRGYDYFDREYSPDIREGNIDQIRRLAKLLMDTPSSAIDTSLSGILNSFSTLYYQYENDSNLRCLTFDRLASVIECFVEASSNIEKLDRSQPAYLNKVFSYLRGATEDIDNILHDIGSLCEERLK